MEGMVPHQPLIRTAVRRGQCNCFANERTKADCGNSGSELWLENCFARTWKEYTVQIQGARADLLVKEE
jgi:hypothetical protein